MNPTKKELASLIIDYLCRTAEGKEIGEDYIDSLNVAIDCVTEAFEVEKESASSVIEKSFGGQSLEQIVGASSKGPTATQQEPVKVNIPVEDAEIKAKAEALKLEGNKAMATKDFEHAISKYSEAIRTLPSNAVYFANRAAAYSSLKKYAEAVEDAEAAIKVNPSYSKGYSRLGFAQYALGRPEEALDAYKKVLDIEGSNATDAMKRDYDTAMKKVEQSLNVERSAPAASNAESPDAAGGSGFPDIASMLGGGLGGGLGGLLKNPQVMQAAQQMMQNPNAMQEMMSNPAIKQMADKFQSGGGTPSMADLMNNPALMDMAKNMFGGPKQ
ncbi:Sgt2p [Lachancea thermotolerans CBS 6340]|uniref:KLTH0C11220p n=1 Tax=Lachancea thermotolerans (strain ATCC 56472 / CBS 6340 / NRRL Y-8284) TaxID=559295 RepID=C5DEQ4_LACTC|nr:KLTH0C11220p [Lachancea thermotolerans CBS 6340]CAR22265.1 KLTH0C11220p [Lachancea thermotolerans CBS 6340]